MTEADNLHSARQSHEQDNLESMPVTWQEVFLDLPPAGRIAIASLLGFAGVIVGLGLIEVLNFMFQPEVML